ncbi:MAG TPA: cytochrome c peroxidase [Bacteroidia bacterium]|nr:cytochrome c peroxidase [Bacteroidia bacterium]
MSKWLALLLLLIVAACKEKVQSPQYTTLALPAHFPPPVYSFQDNPLSSEGIALGKQLFYDPLLSSDSTVACASCHHLEMAFSDGGKGFSTGVNGKQGRRNAPGVFNVLWHPHFMADGGVNHLEVMPLAPITDTLEMNEKISTVNQKIQRSKFYPALFKTAFGSDSITTRKVMLALAQFMGSIISADARYDQVKAGKAKFTQEEKQGEKLFMQQCSGCHSGVLFTDFSFRNNGLSTDFSDPGRARVTSNESDKGKFKVPSLRNVALTAPYMHDGRFASLNEVLNHYRNPMKQSATLDKEQLSKIDLSDEESKAVIAFLHTLTDSGFIRNPAFLP